MIYRFYLIYFKVNMTKLCIILAFLVSLTGFSQTETEAYKTTSEKFITYYNSDNHEAIFNLFSQDMKTTLPLVKTTRFLKGLKHKAGKILSNDFLQFENKSYATYKTQFERALLSLNISLDTNLKINGLFVKPFNDTSFSTSTRNKTSLSLPFNEEWTVAWGGDTEDLNYHVISKSQRNAFDFVMTDDNGKTHKGKGKSNRDYYAFGEPIVAPCKASVVLVINGIKDNTPGKLNPKAPFGNAVILKTATNEYLLFAHFKHNTIMVKEGQQVAQGDVLGHCGNSGNSSEPHLHFHIQNMEDTSNATGIKCFFDNIRVNGQLKTDYSPIKSEKIKNN